MKKTALLFCIPLLLAAFSCVSEFTARVPENEYDLLVVEGDIIGDSLLQFSFSKSFSLNESRPPAGYDDVSIADLAVIGSNGYRSTQATATGNGVYRLSMGKLEDDVEYGIEFKYEGNTYRSELMKPLRTPAIDSVSWSQPVENGEVSISVSTHDDQVETGYYMWKYVEDWEITSAYPVFAMYDPETDEYYEVFDYPGLYYYCWRQNHSNETLIGSTDKLSQNLVLNHPLIKKGANDDRFSELYSVCIKQQAISKAGYEYYLDLLKDNTGMGGLFTPQPSEIEGNITCVTDEQKKVIGHVDVAHNVTTYRMFLPAEKITKYISNSCEALTRREVHQLLGMERELTDLEIYQAGYRPLDCYWYWNPQHIMYILTILDIPDEWGILRNLSTYKIMALLDVIESRGRSDLLDLLSRPKMQPTRWAKSRCTDCRVRGTKTKPSFWPNDHE